MSGGSRVERLNDLMSCIVIFSLWRDYFNSQLYTYHLDWIPAIHTVWRQILKQKLQVKPLTKNTAANNFFSDIKL